MRMACSDWVSRDVMSHILAALTDANRLAIITSLVTGLRISDVLWLRSIDLHKDRFIVIEQKTLKKRNIRLPIKLRQELLAQAGKVYVFENRLSPLKPRTRQAVYKDIKRAATAFRIKLHVSPHSARKIYAVSEYRKDMNLQRVQKLLNHSREAVTLIYCLADELSARRRNKK